MAGEWLSLGTSVSSTNKPVPHDISEIFLNTMTPPTPLILYCNHISCVIVISMLSPSMIDCGYESGSGQTKDYKIGVCCFSAHSTKEKEQRLVESESE